MREELSEAYYIGLLDCIATVGVILTESGVISRESLSHAFGVAAQQQARETMPAPTIAARQAAALSLHRFFATPAAAQLRVLDGGLSGVPIVTPPHDPEI